MTTHLKHLILLTAAGLLTGCGTLPPRYTAESGEMILAVDMPPYYQALDTLPGPFLGKMEERKGERLPVIGYRWGGLTEENYWLLRYRGEPVFVLASDLLFPCEVSYKNQPDTFFVATVGMERAWERAKRWIEKNSTKKIQTYSQYVIQTHNPVGGEIGFTVARKELEEGSEIIVAVRSPSHSSAALTLKKKLAWYIVSGEECTEDIYYRRAIVR